MRRIRGQVAALSGRATVGDHAPANAVVFADPLADYASLLPAGPGRTVVVLADQGLRTQVEPWLRRFATDRVHVISAEAAPEWHLETMTVEHHAGDTPDQLERLTKFIGPVDVLIDLLPGSMDEHELVWRRMFFHLKPGGVYVIDRSCARIGAFTSRVATWASGLIGAPDAAKNPTAEQTELSEAVADVAVGRDLVVFRKRTKHYLKLRDWEPRHLLATREPDICVEDLVTVPAGEFAVRADVVSHEAATDIPWLRERIKYPTLRLHHYQGRIAFAGRTLMYTDWSILPDSFRWHLRDKLYHPQLTSRAPGFARIPDELRPVETLPGRYYQLDSTYSGHFGHLMTEVLSRLWGWDAAKAAQPDLKALMRIPHVNHHQPVLERRLFEAYGIPAEDIVVVDRPVFLHSVVSATPMWHNEVPHYVHPDMAATFERLRAGVVDRSVEGYDKIFVSRASAARNRVCRNSATVEDYFARHGFTVVYPELLDLGEQAGIFARARVIAGFGGSGLFNVMYAENLQTLIVISHEAYTARNEHLYAALLGGTVHYFWSTPDIPRSPKGFTQAAFTSDWEFDFERNGADLDAVFAGL